MSRYLYLLCTALVSFSALGIAATAAELRIVSQTVGTDELLLALAPPGQIAALSHLATDANFSAVAEEAAAYPRITSGDAETILKFQPTLVLVADYSRPELVAQVRRAGVRVWSFDRYATLADAHAALRSLAAELGGEAPTRAEQIVAADEDRVARLAARLAGRPRVAALAPSTYGVVAGAETTFQDLCDHAGAENLASTRGGLHGFARAPSEAMLGWPVEVFVIGEESRGFQAIPPYAQMLARRDIRVVALEPWMLGCVSYLRVDAYEALAFALHPEVLAR
jgi:iron complex transport system substrate-binding protein